MINATRRTFVTAAAAAGATTVLAACAGNESADTATTSTEEGGAETADTQSGAITGSYTCHIQGYDWGCGVDKVTITLDEPIDGPLSADDLTISEHKQTTDWTAEDFPVIEADVPREIVSAELSEDGKTIEVELACAPNHGGSPLLFSMATQYNTWSDPYYLVIGKAEGSAIPELAISTDYDITTAESSADTWAIDTFDASDGTSFQYCSFTPEEASDKLVVWLHGMGEGGTDHTDARIAILGNKVVALSESEFQETVGGANVVAPQCPTYWMDSDGKGGNFVNGGIETVADSFYTAALEEFIDSYAEKVGADKICVCGCSNGGYMTMVLSISRPDAYKCVVPICEALKDELITDEQIDALKDLPMYFVYSKDDTTVDPTIHEVPTIERLKAAGKGTDTLHVSTTDSVIDTSGEFTDEEGNPYAYNGHWSWIYFDNNECECDDEGLKAFDFIAENMK